MDKLQAITYLNAFTNPENDATRAGLYWEIDFIINTSQQSFTKKEIEDMSLLANGYILEEET